MPRVSHLPLDDYLALNLVDLPAARATLHLHLGRLTVGIALSSGGCWFRLYRLGLDRNLRRRLLLGLGQGGGKDTDQRHQAQQSGDQSTSRKKGVLMGFSERLAPRTGEERGPQASLAALPRENQRLEPKRIPVPRENPGQGHPVRAVF